MLWVLSIWCDADATVESGVCCSKGATMEEVPVEVFLSARAHLLSAPSSHRYDPSERSTFDDTLRSRLRRSSLRCGGAADVGGP